MTPPMYATNTAMAGLPSVRDISGVFRQFMGIPAEGGPDYRTLKDFARAPADEAWVYACVMRRAKAAQSVPLRVQVRDGKVWVDHEDRSDPAAVDLQTLLDDVNPDWEGGELKAYTEAGNAVHGGCYWRKVRGRLGGAPQELYWLSGAEVSPVKGRTILTEKYEHKSGGVTERYESRDIVPFRGLNLQDPTQLLSPLRSAANELQVNINASEWTAQTLKNWGIPVGAWVLPKGADVTAQEQRGIRAALRALRGPRNANKTPVLPEGIDWKPLSLNPKDAEWLQARKVSRMTICAVLGVPLVLAGDDEKNTVYAAVRDAERVFWRNTVITQLDWIASKINGFLVPDFAPKKTIRVAFDYSGIEALQPTWTEQALWWTTAASQGVIDREEVRSKVFSLPPMTTEQQAAAAPPAAQTPGEAQPGQQPRDHIRSMGKALYKSAAVRAYLTTGQPAVLDALMGPLEPDLRDRLAVGLQRRYSAQQIADGVPTEGYPGLNEVSTP